MNTMAWAIAEALKIDQFRAWCRAMQVDPEPSLEWWKRSALPLDEFLSRERSRLATERLADA